MDGSIEWFVFSLVLPQNDSSCLLGPAGERPRACSPGARPQPGGKRVTAPIGNERRHRQEGLPGSGEGVRGRGCCLSGRVCFVRSCLGLPLFPTDGPTDFEDKVCRCPPPFPESPVLLFLRCFSLSSQIKAAGFFFLAVREPIARASRPKTPTWPPSHRASAMLLVCPSDGRYPDRRGKPCGVFPSPASRMPRNRPEMPLEVTQGGGVVVPYPPERNRGGFAVCWRRWWVVPSAVSRLCRYPVTTDSSSCCCHGDDEVYALAGL